MNELLYGFAMSFVMTMVFELAFCFLWGVHDKRNILLIFLINLMTNPLAVGICYRFSAGYALKIPLEIGVAVVEAIYLSKFGKGIKYPAVLAVLMNIFSFSLGELINYA